MSYAQDNELIEKFRAKRAERTAQQKARGDRRRLIIVGSAVGAALLLAAILCLIFIRPVPDTDPTTARAFLLRPGRFLRSI